MNDVVLIVVAAAISAGMIVGAILWLRQHDVTLAQRVLEEAQRQKAEELNTITSELKTAFAALSREALSSNTDDFFKLAKDRLEQETSRGEKTLEEKKKLIDAHLAELNNLVQSVRKQGSETYGALQTHVEATKRLHEATAHLREALANPQRRGQWGERMAEDVLRLAGFVEGVNYVKQQQVQDGSRPDFTFPLPDDRRVHMDVKFPLANYLKMLDAPDESARKASTAQFLRDVRMRIKEVATRSYIDPARGTVDYVLAFIPNEQVYGFIHQQDSSLLDEALRNKVVLCSPMTLYAILAVIRQAADNFRLEQHSKQVLELLASFHKEWGKYVEVMESMGRRLDAAVTEYEQLVGVRTRKLDRQLERIEDLRSAREEPGPVPLSASDDG